MYSKYVASVPLQIMDVLSVVPLVYLIIYVIYRLVVWMKDLRICKKKHRDEVIPESEEPDRLTHPEDYENEEEIKLLISDDQGNDHQKDPKLETYPACGNSQQKYGSVRQSTIIILILSISPDICQINTLFCRQFSIMQYYSYVSLYFDNFIN